MQKNSVVLNSISFLLSFGEKKKTVEFTVTCPKKIGPVGRDFFFFFFFSIQIFNVLLSLCFKSAIL